MSELIKLEGLKPLQDNIKKLTGEELAKIETKAVKEAGALVKKKVEDNITHLGLIDTGALKRNVVVEMARAGKQTHGKYEAHIFIKHGRKGVQNYRRDDDPCYWHIPEFGSIFQPATPYLRPALEDNQMEILDTYQAVFKTILNVK